MINWEDFAKGLRVVQNTAVIGYVHPRNEEYHWWRTGEEAWGIKLAGQPHLTAWVRLRNSAYDMRADYQWEATMQVSFTLPEGSGGHGTYWVARRCRTLQATLVRCLRALKRRDVLYRLGVKNAGFTLNTDGLNP